MQSTERDLTLIEVILDDAKTLDERLRHFNVTESSFKNDYSFEGQAAFDLIMAPVYRMAEDALHLSSELMLRHPDYPWDDIRGFRNFVAHGYRNVDRQIAWGVISVDIPRLAEILREESK